MWCKTLLFSFLLPLYSLHTTSFKWIPGISWNFFLFSFISLSFVQNPSFNLVMAGLADFVELGLSLMSETKDIRSSLNHGDTFDFFFFHVSTIRAFYSQEITRKETSIHLILKPLCSHGKILIYFYVKKSQKL